MSSQPRASLIYSYQWRYVSKRTHIKSYENSLISDAATRHECQPWRLFLSAAPLALRYVAFFQGAAGDTRDTYGFQCGYVFLI